MKKFVLLAIAASFQCALMAQPQPKYAEKVVYEDSNVIFRQIDEQTWEGNGHLMANESLYLIAGTESAILIDAIPTTRVRLSTSGTRSRSTPPTKSTDPCSWWAIRARQPI